MKHYIFSIIIVLWISLTIILCSTQFKKDKLKNKQMDFLLKKSFYLTKQTEYFSNDTLYNYYDSLFKVEDKIYNDIDSMLIFNKE